MATPIPILVLAPESSDMLRALGHRELTSRVHPALIVTTPAHFGLVRSIAGDQALYPIAEAHAGSYPHAYPGGTLAADAYLLDELQAWLPTVYALVDRKNWSGASLSAIHRLVTRYAAIWSNVLDRIQPQLVLWHDTPQRGFDFVLYALCLHRSIRTGIVGFTSLRDRLVFQETIDGPIVPLFHGRSVLSPDEADSMLDSFYSREIIPQQIDASRNLRTTLAFGGHMWQRLRTTSNVPTRFPSVVPDQQLQRASRLLAGVRNRRHIRSAFTEYVKASSELRDDDGPYVYYALHFQPEATTVPRGGVQWDQLNNIRILAEGLPPGWSVVAKEHPMMMRYRWDWHRARGAAYYAELRSIGGVKLAPITTSSTELIDGAAGVATTTGTVGWEALLAGKPVAVFGYPWYSSAPNVTVTRSRDDVGKWIEGLGGHVKPDELAASTFEFVRAFVPRFTFYGRWQETALESKDSAGLDSVSAYAEAMAAFIDRPVQSEIRGK